MHRFIPRLFVGALLCLGLVTASCAKTDYVHLFHSDAHAPSYTPDDIQAMKYMGPTFVDKGVNFAVYSEHATKMQLLLFDSQDAALPSRTYEMTRIGNVWSTYVEGIGDGQIYGYVAWGPNWPYQDDWYCGSISGFISDVDANGNRFNPNKLLIDPYAKAITRDFDWSKGTSASGPGRTNCDYAAQMKSIVVKSKYVWSDNEKQYRENRKNPMWEGHKPNQLIIYEVHPKGFTASPASRAIHPGTFRGIGENADYFKELGVTAVELMPVFEKPSDGGYWGYQTLDFFAPEITYSSMQGPGEPMDEFKWMVDELHKRNIEVLVDVVYNHTGEGGLWREKIEGGGASLDHAATDPRYYQNLDPKEVAGLYVYRGLDNAGYYALTPDNQFYNDGTGVGNMTRANHTPWRHLILDSLRYWAEEMHVDGFRFDLAPVLGLGDLTYQCWDSTSVQGTVLQKIIDDPTLQKWNTRIIAEPWMYGCYGVGKFPNSSNYPGYGWYEWNGPFRDDWRALVNSGAPSWSARNFGDWSLSANNAGVGTGGAMYGSQELYAQNGRKPYDSINFVTIHDGFTMYDLVSYDDRQNGCSPLNPDCCQPVTAYCNDDGQKGYDNRSSNWGSVDSMTCDDNYCDDSTTRKIPDWDWNKRSACYAAQNSFNEGFKRQLMRDFFTAMIVARGTPMLLGGDEWMRTQLGNNNAYTDRADNPYNWFDWGSWEPDATKERMHDFVRKLLQFRKTHEYAFAPMNYSDNPPQWMAPDGSANVDWNGKVLGIHYLPNAQGPELLILINMSNSPVSFTLPTGRSWFRVIDTQEAFDDPHTYVFPDCHDAGGFGSAPGLISADSTTSANIDLNAPVQITDPSYLTAGHSIVVLEVH